MRPLVYVAGPYTSNPVANTREAVRVAEMLERNDCDVFIPHLSMLWDIISPAPVERWYERDNAILVRCDAVYRFEGESTGADAEVALAEAHDIPVLYNLYQLARWQDVATVEVAS